MKIDHIAVASNTEAQSDDFFVNLLGLKKARMFVVSSGLSEKFFGIKKELSVIRYQNEHINVEVFITNDNSKAKDAYTHPCLLVGKCEELVKKASSMGFEVIKVQRKDSKEIIFIKDYFQNLYEIKSANK